jgi:uncharacterized membrane protein YphA (DoxX/SURF4 family)
MTNRVSTILGYAAPFLRWVAGSVLALSGYLKAVRHPAEFEATLASYWFFPGVLLAPLARVVPWLELVVGLALVAGYFTRATALVGAALYAGFVMVLGQAILRKVPLTDCGCFGQVGPHLQPIQAFSLDVVMLVFCLLVFFDKEKKVSADRWIDK